MENSTVRLPQVDGIAPRMPWSLAELRSRSRGHAVAGV